MAQVRDMPWDMEASGAASSSDEDLEEDLLQESGGGLAASWPPRPVLQRWVLPSTALLLCGTAVFSWRGASEVAFPPHPPLRAGRDELAAILAHKAQVLAETAETSDAFEKAKQEWKKANATGKLSDGSNFDTDYVKGLFDKFTEGIGPKMDIDDGNVCADDEEKHAGLCYKQCKLLTNGTHPYRSTAMSCAKTKSLNPMQMSWKFSICGGYDVAGDSQGEERCPHQPGSCLLNEEMLLGTCYMKCEIITEGSHPNRVGPSTCCSSFGPKCMDPRKLKTSASINVGGGAGDGDPNTPDKPHKPLKSLTDGSR